MIDSIVRKSSQKLVVFLIVLGMVTLPGLLAAGMAMAQGSPAVTEYDPWEPFNSKMFWFNRNVLDQYILKPLAQAWDFALPGVARRSLRNAVDNTNVLPRLVNSLAQGKWPGAGREAARFTINSTVGVAGLFDIAKDGFGIEKSDEDTGQTLGFYGVGTGPYLVLPFFPPLDVRDGVGAVVDGAMNPVNYLIPFAAEADGGTTAGTLIGIAFLDAVNRRSLDLKFYEGVEETVIDLYSAVRNGYLQKREAKIKE
ncbi:MAG: VacJ family lipoprotein [Deltaproteobacteria bacterium]|nr:VacJ family lipoprotein [Deltaproteobacteria bacterium]